VLTILEMNYFTGDLSQSLLKANVTMYQGIVRLDSGRPSVCKERRVKLHISTLKTIVVYSIPPASLHRTTFGLHPSVFSERAYL
jgi:hypothetical protein